MFPVAVVGGIVLVALAGTRNERISVAIFALTGALLFGTSALFHRGSWSPRAYRLLRRMDHSNIFLIIAGTYWGVNFNACKYARSARSGSPRRA